MNNDRPRKNVTVARPNAQAKWVCGYARLGLGCTEGPDDHGACCQLRKDRERPEDNRICHEACSCKDSCELARLRLHPEVPSHAELGPCLPQRTAWFSRQTLTLNFGILTAGILLLTMSLPQREAIYVPGGLAKDHAQILGNHLVSDRCSLCHPGSHSNQAGLLQQDDLCIACHQSHLPDARLRSPHDLSRAQLVQLTAKANPFANLSESKADQPTRCATCHIEHHGAGFDLTAVSNANCQACHQRRFNSLSDGHPPFERYPYHTERRIAFDHAAHESKYFGTKNESFDCRRCHFDGQRPGELGSIFRATSFAQACSGCHQQGIQASTVNGWALLQLPSIEATDTRNSALGLAQWPHRAQFGYEGQIDVPLRLLLSADPEMHEALALLPASGNLQHLANNAELRGQAVRSLARGLRRLIGEVAAEGQAAWQRRLATTATQQLGRELNARELKLIAALSQGVPPDLFRQMESHWFAAKAGEVAFDDSQSNSKQKALPTRMVSQYANDDSLLVESSDDSLLGDGQVDRKLREESVDSLASEQALFSHEVAPEPGTATELAALRGSQHVAAGGWYLDHELLALRYMPRGHADETLAAWGEFIALIDAADTRSKVSDERSRDATRPKRIPQLTHGPTIPGDCTQCHLLNYEMTQAAAADELRPLSKWTSVARTSSIRLFTKFDHTPHLTLPSLNDCRYCHQLNGQKLSSLEGVLVQHISGSVNGLSSPGELTKASSSFLQDEFVGMHVQQCSACHRSGAASNDCTQCHNYHVGTSGLTRSN